MTVRFYHGQGCNNAFIEFNGKEVLYSLNIESEPEWRMVIIAGYVVGKPCKDVPEAKVLVTDVERITSPVEKRELSDLLRKKEERNIVIFWD